MNKSHLGMLTPAVITTLLFVSFSFAETSSTQISLDNNAAASSLKLTESKLKTSESQPTELYLSHQSFIRSEENFFGPEYNSNQLSVVGADIRYHESTSADELKLDFGAFHSFNEETQYLNVREFYKSFHRDQTSVSIGRKLHTWSSADEEWNLGLWQPEFRWDRTRHIQEGLTGLFFDRELTGRSQLTVLVSPLFIPDSTVQFNEDGGKFRSKNPWFKPPPDEANIFEEDNEIFAYLDRPETKDVVLNPSFAASYLNELNDNNKVRVSYGYKPINQLMNSLSYKLRVAGESDSGVRLTIDPKVYYHHLLATEYQYKDRYFTSAFSATYEKPTRQFEDDDLVYQRLRDAQILSWTSSYALSGEGDSAFRIFGGYIRHFGGYEKDGGDVFDDGTLFEIRPRYISTFRAGLSYPVFRDTRSIRNRIEVNYDTIMNGGTVLTEVEYAFGDNLFVTGMLDIIGVFEVREDTLSSQYLHTFRANDKAQLRLSYVY